ncbi:hypothetical protein QJS66_15985 [Kocuria rhizophila]|nr:hypothetical protein QJS66_15985 [Kocuria rhizophila]
MYTDERPGAAPHLDHTALHPGPAGAGHAPGRRAPRGGRPRSWSPRTPTHPRTWASRGSTASCWRVA